MIIGFLLVIGGAALLAAGWYAAITALTVLGGAWIVGGLVNIVLSKLARRGQSPVRGEDMTNPMVRARAYRGVKGAPVRGVIALICAIAAITVGILTPGFDVTSGADITRQAWRIVPIVAGCVIGFLSLVGFLVYWGSSVERSATIPATVVILGFKELSLNASNSRPYVRFVFDVYPQGMSHYEATVQTVVTLLTIPKLVVGAQFSALVTGPSKPENVIVDWNSPVGAAPTRATQTPTPPAPTAADEDPASRIRELDALHAQGLVTADEYQAQRTRILDSL